MIRKEPSASLAVVLLRFMIGKGRGLCLLVLLIVTAAAGYPALRIEVENDNSSMVSHNRELQRRYDDFRKSFGNDEVLLLAITTPDLLRPEGQQRINLIATDLKRIKGVSAVTTPFLPQSSPGMTAPVPALFPLPPTDSGRVPVQLPMLLSADQETVLILIHLSAAIDEQQNALLEVENLIDGNDTELGLRLAGIPMQKLTVTRLIQRDQRVLIPLSVAILGLLLLLFFRRAHGVILPLAVMAISLCWTLALYSMSGYSLNTITALLPPVIMVLSVTTTVHLYNNWLHGCPPDQDPAEHIIAVVQSLFRPCLFTTLTTAMGLASLMVSSIPAVRLFGGFAAVGVCLSFVVGFVLVPVTLSFLHPPPPGQQGTFPLLHQTLQKTAAFSINRPGLVFLCALAAALLAVAGIPHINNNTNLINFFKPAEKLRLDTTSIDQALGGVNRIEFILARKDNLPFTQEQNLRQLVTFQQELDTLPQVTGSDSFLSLLQSRIESSGPVPFFSGEHRSASPVRAIQPEESSLISRFINSDHTRLRLSVRTAVLGSAETAALIRRIENLADGMLGEEYALTPTGEAYQLAIDSNQLVGSLVKSFSLSLAMILTAILVMFRSFKLLSVALIPNLIPLVWTFGLMGLLTIDLSTGTAMIAAVAIGLTVDSTIHYLAGYRRADQGDIKAAVIHTTTTTGQALTISALVLFCGFAVGGASSFLPTVYFSLLTGLTMLGALLCDLIILPAGLVLIDRLNNGRPTC